MGLLISKLSQALFKTEPVKILLLGLDGAGKTTILYKLKLNQTVATVSTIGFNVEEVTPIKNVTFTMWDISGSHKIRASRRHYYEGSQGLLFVVDASDTRRLSEAREELFGVLKEDGMESGCPVVVLANKQDLPDSLTAHELIDQMTLQELQTNPWHVQEMCAKNGNGLYQSIQKLNFMVKTFQKERKKRPR